MSLGSACAQSDFWGLSCPNNTFQASTSTLKSGAKIWRGYPWWYSVFGGEREFVFRQVCVNFREHKTFTKCMHPLHPSEHFIQLLYTHFLFTCKKML
jgi:hypothetical protein